MDCMVDVQDVTIRFNMASEKIDNLKEYAIKFLKRELMFKEFFALKNVSFQVKRGEAWGLIGTNGSGKSTLLKAICGILKPYHGQINVYGSIAPLIELGAGFDGELTAEENIYLNGAVLGHSKKFMREHFNEIVDFAELWDFLDMPIKNYSSGMAARLGFSIATVVRPDILICDEVLSVGDYAFQRKCERRMNEMRKDGTTLLYVSHSMDSVRKICDHALWLDKGIARSSGEVRTVSRLYLNSLNGISESTSGAELTDESCRSLSVFCAPEAKRSGPGDVRFTNIELLDDEGKSGACFNSGGKITVRFQYSAVRRGLSVSFAFGLVTKNHTDLYRTSTRLEYQEMLQTEMSGALSCTLEAVNIADGQYYLEARIWNDNEFLYDSITDFILVDIKGSPRNEQGLVHIPHSWSLQPASIFYQEEVRENFLVTETRKRIWAIELDLANKLLSVCRENNLNIYADAGTMLGAVRHKGFIPWDDDMDFAMMRDDYEKLCVVAPRYFQKPYFFQNIYTDKDYTRGHAQIRNSYTTGCLPGEEGRSFNQGIFIDLFILDCVTTDSVILERQRRISDVLKSFIFASESGKSFVWPDDFKIPETLSDSPTTKQCIEYLDRMFRETHDEHSDKVAPLNFVFDTEKRIRNKSLYEDVVWMDFEYLKVPVPCGYDLYLRNRYGDYMVPHNVPNTHGKVIFDTEHSYIEYLNRVTTKNCEEK